MSYRRHYKSRRCNVHKNALFEQVKEIKFTNIFFSYCIFQKKKTFYSNVACNYKEDIKVLNQIIIINFVKNK